MDPRGTADPLAERYGRRPDAGPARRRALVAVAALLVAVAVGWSLWVARSVAERPLTWQVFGYRVAGEDRVVVTFDVTFRDGLPAGTRAVCTLQALNEGHAEVGLEDVTVGPATGTLRSTATVRTTERAVTGTVKGCTVAR